MATVKTLIGHVKGDTGVGVASGGTTGQVLRKKSATDFDTDWMSLPTEKTKLSEFTDDLGSSPTHTHSQYLTSHQDISGKENTANKVTSISSSSTNTEYPSALAVYAYIQSLDGNSRSY